MKVNIKDDQSEQKKDFEKLATIKKSVKAGDSKIFGAKKIAISQAIIDASSNQTPASAATSTSNENLFSQFTNPQKAFTPLASTFSSAALSKGHLLIGNRSKFCHQGFVFGKQSLVPGVLQNDNQSSTTEKPSMHNSLVLPPKINAPQTATSVPMKGNTALNDSLTNQQSSTTVSMSVHNSLVVSDIMNSVQTVAGAQAMNTTFNNSLSNLQSSTSGRSLSNLLSTTAKPSMQNSSVSNAISLAPSLSDAQPMEENGTFDDFLRDQETSNTMTSSIQNNSCSNVVNSQPSVSTEKTVKKNTKQVSMPPLQPSMENVNSGKSSHAQRFSVSIPVPAPNSHIYIQHAYDILQKLKNSLQYSISTQTQVSNTTLSVSKDKNILPSQKSSTKGVKRKAEETKNVVKNTGNLENIGKKKKNKKKQKFVQPRIVMKNPCNSQNNFSEIKNSNALTCAIVEEQYPNMPPLTNVHLGIIRNVIKEKIDNIPVGVFVPKFMNAFVKDGVILVECANSNSKDWLKHAITNYNPQEGVYLKVIPPDAINEYYPASIFVHDEENAIDVLRRLQKQNSDVSIKNWQYLSMIIVKESTSGITINVAIPATSVAQLKEKNFKLFHAMDQVMVVMKVAVPF